MNFVDMIQFAVAGILILGALLELRVGRIPNWLTILPLILFVVLLVMAEDRSPLYWQIALAAGAFALGLLAFAIGGAGAGAVKLLAGAALFVPLDRALFALLAFALFFIFFAIAVFLIRGTIGRDDSKWYILSKPVLPLGLPIAVGAMAGMFTG